MSATALISDFANLTKQSKDTITLKPTDAYRGTELNDMRLNKLYGMYCGLVLEQYTEDKAKNEGLDM